MGRVIVAGDLHGAYKALIQCLERSNFDYENDILIQLGDVVDGWSEVYQCVSELCKIKNLIPILGNHDAIFNVWLTKGVHPWAWLQGGDGTAKSYINMASGDSEIGLHLIPRDGGFVTNLCTLDVPKSHQKFFNSQILKYIDSKNRCFVHGGFDRLEKISSQNENMLIWDRELWNKALSCGKDDYKTGYKGIQKLKTADDFSEIYIGHTSTMYWGQDFPMKAGGVTNMDTGAGFKGKLSFMDVDTYQVWQSDLVQELYKDEMNSRNYGK